ncbi:MAG: trigger factor [Lachnospiraceae bacterium]|nr:trigger factor [Lachnospiraceae bacterium]
MNVQTELIGEKKAKLLIEIPAENFRKALNRVYNRQKGRLVVPGFRKGKAPRKVLEKLYGQGIFYEDAANELISEEYPKAYEECGLDIVSRPDIEVQTAEEGKPFVFTAVVALRPDVHLSQYKGVEVRRIDTGVSEEEIDQEIDNELKTNSRSVTVEDEAREGDTVLIDYEGFSEGVAFEGGKGENFPLELGSHSFIEGFEDQLIGVEAGDEVQVDVTFPDEYHAPDLAGKDAVFIVKVHEVRRPEVPELDEEYIEDIGFDSLDEYRDDVRSRIETRKKDDAKRRHEDEAIHTIADESEIDVPEEMIETQLNSALNDYANNIMQNGFSFSDYLKMTGMTVERMRDQLRPETVDRIRASLILEEIAKVEDLKATEEDVQEKIEEAAKNYHMKVEDLEKDLPDKERESLKSQIAMEKAIKLILDNVVEVDRED